MYDETSEEVSVVPGTLQDLVVSHVSSMIEIGKVLCIAEEVSR